MADELTVAERPEAWNAKYRQYLGIDPATRAEGVMQDTHWVGGMVGYFPTYSLGNLYGLQFAHKMERDIPELQKQIAAGRFGLVKDWLCENIHSHGAVYRPKQLIERVTGEPLQSRYYVEYLQRKFSELYGI